MDILERIEALENESSRAGDLLQAAICQIALLGEPHECTHAALSHNERVTLQLYSTGHGWNKAAAIAECKRVIAEAMNCECHVGPEWSGRPNPENPDNEWICDECGRAIQASAVIVEDDDEPRGTTPGAASFSGNC